MSINPQVKQQLKGVSDLELKRLVMSSYRYNSFLGKGIADAVGYEESTGDEIAKNFSVENGDFIEKQAVIVFTELFPDFDRECLAYLNQLPEDQRTVREVFHRLAIYLAENISNINHDDRDALFDLIEFILNQGEVSLKYLIGNYFLEDLQNILGNLGDDPEKYVPYLKPVTKEWWVEINRFWRDLEGYYSEQRNHVSPAN